MQKVAKFRKQLSRYQLISLLNKLIDSLQEYLSKVKVHSTSGYYEELFVHPTSRVDNILIVELQYVEEPV